MIQPRQSEWMHLFNELVEKQFPTAAAGLWLDILNRKLYWVDPPEKPIRSQQWTEALTQDVEQALAAVSDFLGQAAAKIRRIAFDPEADEWDVGQAALEEMRKGCVDIIRTRRGSCPGERAKAVIEALGDPDCEIIKNDLTDAELAEFHRNLESANKE
jgi:hypothetical protein